MAWELELLAEMEDEELLAEERLRLARIAHRLGEIDGRIVGRLTAATVQACNRVKDAAAMQRVADKCGPVEGGRSVRFRRTGEHILRHGKYAIHAIEADGRWVGFLARFWGDLEIWLYGDQAGTSVRNMREARNVVLDLLNQRR